MSNTAKLIEAVRFGPNEVKQEVGDREVATEGHTAALDALKKDEAQEQTKHTLKTDIGLLCNTKSEKSPGPVLEEVVKTQDLFTKRVGIFKELLAEHWISYGLIFEEASLKEEEFESLEQIVKKLDEAVAAFNAVLNSENNGWSNENNYEGALSRSIQRLDMAVSSKAFENMNIAAAALQAWVNNNKATLDSTDSLQRLKAGFKQRGYDFGDLTTLGMLGVQRVQRLQLLAQEIQKQTTKPGSLNALVERLGAYVECVFNSFVQSLPKTKLTIDTVSSLYEKNVDINGFLSEDAKQARLQQKKQRTDNDTYERVKESTLKSPSEKWTDFVKLAKESNHVPSMLQLGKLAVVEGDNKTARECFKLAYYHADKLDVKKQALEYFNDPTKSVPLKDRLSHQLSHLANKKPKFNVSDVGALVTSKEEELKQQPGGLEKIVAIKLVELEAVKPRSSGFFSSKPTSMAREDFEKLGNFILEECRKKPGLREEGLKIAASLEKLASNESEKNYAQIVTKNLGNGEDMKEFLSQAKEIIEDLESTKKTLMPDKGKKILPSRFIESSKAIAGNRNDRLDKINEAASALSKVFHGDDASARQQGKELMNRLELNAVGKNEKIIIGQFQDMFSAVLEQVQSRAPSPAA